MVVIVLIDMVFVQIMVVIAVIVIIPVSSLMVVIKVHTLVWDKVVMPF